MRALVVLVALLVPAAAVAKKHAGRRGTWPSPALGPSASGQPEVLFTFDDGPGGALTSQLLDVLRAHDVHAIFFLIGNRLTGKGKARALVQRMLDEGHAVGNHTQHHRDLCLHREEKKIDTEIDDARALVEAASGMAAVLFRLPFGVRCSRLEEALAARRLTHIHWDVDPQEWKTHDAAATRLRIVSAIARLRDGERAVILAHDIHPETIEAMPAVLAWIDEENARRRAAGRKEIRIIDPATIAAEKLLPGVAAAARGAVEAAAGFAPSILRRALGPLAAPRSPSGGARRSPAGVAGAPL